MERYHPRQSQSISSLQGHNLLSDIQTPAESPKTDQISARKAQDREWNVQRIANHNHNIVVFTGRKHGTFFLRGIAQHKKR